MLYISMFMYDQSRMNHIGFGQNLERHLSKYSAQKRSTTKPDLFLYIEYITLNYFYVNMCENYNFIKMTNIVLLQKQKMQ